MGNWSRWTRGTSRSSRLANLLAPFSLFRSRHSTRRNAQSRAVTGMGPYSFFLCVCLKCWCGGVSASSHRGGRLLLLLSGPDSLSLSLWLSTSLSLSLCLSHLSWDCLFLFFYPYPLLSDGWRHSPIETMSSASSVFQLCGQRRRILLSLLYSSSISPSTSYNIV